MAWAGVDVSTLEAVIVSGIVVLAIALVVYKFAKPFGKPKGSCRACGDSCGCEAPKKRG